VGSRLVTIRKVGRRERTMTMEMTSITPPRQWAARGIDGPIRAILNGTVEPLDDGGGSRVRIELDFEGYGLGKLLVPLVVRRQVQRELPRNVRNLKERLERGA
jgi:Polyketide cyclase / dehydrase and lipid transport